jgi:hypothetical protein
LIGIKYVGIGLVSFVITAFFLVRIMDETLSSGFGAAIWAVMIMFCSKEAYAQGKKSEM